MKKIVCLILALFTVWCVSAEVIDGTYKKDNILITAQQTVITLDMWRLMKSSPQLEEVSPIDLEENNSLYKAAKNKGMIVETLDFLSKRTERWYMDSQTNVDTIQIVDMSSGKILKLLWNPITFDMYIYK